MRLRSFLFWLHLSVGLVALPVIVVLSGTGVILAYQRQILVWYDTHDYRMAPPSPDTPRLTPDQLVAAVRAGRPDVSVASITFHADPEAPAEVGTATRRTLFLNPYTGSIWGESTEGPRPFFRMMSSWHTGLGSARGGLGHTIAAASNLVVAFMIVVGLILWWPRNLSWGAFRNAVWFRRRLRAKARDFSWHHVIGLWCALPLFVVVIGALPMSYPWASDLVFRAVGQPPEPRRGSGPGPTANGGQAMQQSGRGRGQRGGGPPGRGRARGSEGRGGPVEGRGRGGAASRGATPGGGLAVDMKRVTELWARAEAQGWRTVTARLPTAPDAPIEFTTETGTSQQPQNRSVLSLDMKSGQVTSLVTFGDRSFGARIRTYLRFAHTGEVLGFFTQTIAAVACVGACVMAWTGVALSWRRFVGRRTRRERMDGPSATPPG